MSLYNYRAIVASIRDADTLVLEVDLGFSIHQATVIRLNGIDAPELKTEEGKLAKQWLEQLLPIGSAVYVVTFKDKQEKYGRYLGVLYRLQTGGGVEIVSVNDQMLQSGHAMPYQGGPR